MIDCVTTANCCLGMPWCFSIFNKYRSYSVGYLVDSVTPTYCSHVCLSLTAGIVLIVQRHVCSCASRFSRAVWVTLKAVCRWCTHPLLCTVSMDTRSHLHGARLLSSCSPAWRCSSTRGKRKTPTRTNRLYSVASELTDCMRVISTYDITVLMSHALAHWCVPFKPRFFTQFCRRKAVVNCLAQGLRVDCGRCGSFTLFDAYFLRFRVVLCGFAA